MLTPRSELNPHFSFPLPLIDTDVNLGKAGHLDRRGDQFHHLGDLTARVRAPRGGAYATCSSVGRGAVLAASRTADSATFKRGDVNGAHLRWRHARDVALHAKGDKGDAECGALRVTRTLEAEGGQTGGIRMRFELTNHGDEELSIGALALSMPFDQDFVGRTLVQVAQACSFAEPFLGGESGYVQARPARHAAGTPPPPHAGTRRTPRIVGDARDGRGAGPSAHRRAWHVVRGVAADAP